MKRRRRVRLEYDRRGDTAYIFLVDGVGVEDLNDAAPCDPEETMVNFGFNAEGALVAIVVPEASKVLPTDFLGVDPGGRRTMRLQRDRGGDAAYILLVRRIGFGGAKRTVPCDPTERMIILDFDGEGRLLGIEVLGASTVLPKDFLRARSLTWMSTKLRPTC